MEYVYMFTGVQLPGQDYKWVSRTAFLKEFDVPRAVRYLQTIRDRIRNEGTDAHFFSALRHVFSELDGLGKLFAGAEGKDDTAINAVAYGESYLGQVNKLYQKLYGLLFELYRHGLTHTGLPRTVRFRTHAGNLCFLAWALRATAGEHLVLKPAGNNAYHLWLSVAQFRDDAARSVDLYVKDVEQRGPRSRLFTRLRAGYYGTAVAFREGTQPPRPRVKKKHTQLFTGAHAARGLAWVKHQVKSLTN